DHPPARRKNPPRSPRRRPPKGSPRRKPSRLRCHVDRRGRWVMALCRSRFLARTRAEQHPRCHTDEARVLTIQGMDLPESGAAATGAPNPAEGFPTATYQQWRELVAGVLRKSGVAEERLTDTPEAVLATRTYDGFDIAPLYTFDPATPDPGFPGLAPFTRGHRPAGALTDGWDIRARYTDPEPKTLKERLHTDLMNGVNSLWISVGGAALPADDLGQVLTDVYLDLAPVVLSAGGEYTVAADALLRAHADADVPHGRIISHLGIDPLTTAARTGEHPPMADAAGFAADRAKDRPGLG